MTIASSGASALEPSPAGLAATRILLALDAQTCPRASLLRTFELARSLDAPLEGVRVLPDAFRWLRWLPRALLRRITERQMDRARGAARATRYELAPVYEDEPPRGRIVVRTGSFVEQVTAHAKKRGATLIVLPPGGQRLGRLATNLALATACRVLVPRPMTRRKTILAASDLVTRGLPILREGTLLAAPLRMNLLSFHNVDPLSDDGDDAADGGVSRLRLAQRIEQARESLSTVSAAAVRAGIDPADSILAEARDSQADLVIVGVRPRSRLERLVYGSTAARVVEKAPCSVMVTPVRGEHVHRG